MLPILQDSGDEWLEHLFSRPVVPPVVVDTESDEEFLQELLTPPPDSTPGTVLALREKRVPCAPQATEPRPKKEQLRKRPAETQGRPPRAKTNKGDNIPCIGCPDEMADEHGALLAGIYDKDQISDGGIMLLFRQNTFQASQQAMQRLSVSLCERIESLLQRRGICIFKIGITRDPCYRMYNEEFGYARHGELYDQMDLLVASYPGVCACLERMCIRSMGKRQGCRNVLPGGENAPASGICYLYVVSLPCGDGRPIPTR